MQPVSITGQLATPTTDTPCVTVTDTCGFNTSIVLIYTAQNFHASYLKGAFFLKIIIGYDRLKLYHKICSHFLNSEILGAPLA